MYRRYAPKAISNLTPFLVLFSIIRIMNTHIDLGNLHSMRPSTTISDHGILSLNMSSDHKRNSFRNVNYNTPSNIRQQNHSKNCISVWLLLTNMNMTTILLPQLYWFYVYSACCTNTCFFVIRRVYTNVYYNMYGFAACTVFYGSNGFLYTAWHTVHYYLKLHESISFNVLAFNSLKYPEIWKTLLRRDCAEFWVWSSHFSLSMVLTF